MVFGLLLAGYSRHTLGTNLGRLRLSGDCACCIRQLWHFMDPQLKIRLILPLKTK